jgi:quercetin dioxygenase-like cupin family protein
VEPDARLLADDPAAEIVPGVVMRGVWGERGMLNVIELAPGGEVPLHSHPHEQLGYVLEGEITMTVAGVTDTWRAGVAYAIPGGVEHAGVAGLEGCRVIDVFVPVRDEYRDKLVAAGR